MGDPNHAAASTDREPAADSPARYARQRRPKIGCRMGGKAERNSGAGAKKPCTRSGGHGAIFATAFGVFRRRTDAQAARRPRGADDATALARTMCDARRL